MPLADTFVSAARSPHPVTGDDYAPYNKPAALAAWTQDEGPREPTVLVLDPDCVFLDRLILDVEPGDPVAQPSGFMNAAEHASVLYRHFPHAEVLQPLSVPLVIHRDDLHELAPLWLARTEDLREDPLTRERLGWVSEMWGCSIAAAQLGLRFELRSFALLQGDDKVSLPLIHYAYESASPDGTWRWEKRAYRPWDRVPDPPPGTPAASVALIRLLNEFGKTR